MIPKILLSGRKLVVPLVVASMVILITITPLLMTGSTSSSAVASAFVPQVGATLSYTFTGGDTISSNQTIRFLKNEVETWQLPVQNPNYFMVLDSDYDNLIAASRSTHSVSLASGGEKMCKLAFRTMNVDIKILSIAENDAMLEVTLRLGNGAGVCGPEFGDLPRIDRQWVLQNDSYRGTFATLRVTRTMTLNLSNGDLVIDNGRSLGEWPIWLTNHDLLQNSTIVLYGLDEIVGRNTTQGMLQGDASLLFLDTSQHPRTTACYAGACYPSSAQLQISKSLLHSTCIANGVPFGREDLLVSEVLQEYSGCSSCTESAGHYIYPFAASAGHGEVILNPDPLPGSLDLGSKPWVYNGDLGSSSSSLQIGGSTFSDSVVIRGIEYAGVAYPTAGFRALQSAAYSSDGLLLYVRTDSRVGPQTFVLPTFVSRGFGIVPLFFISNGGSLTMTVDSISP